MIYMYSCQGLILPSECQWGGWRVIRKGFGQNLFAHLDLKPDNSIGREASQASSWIKSWGPLCSIASEWSDKFLPEYICLMWRNILCIIVHQNGWINFHQIIFGVGQIFYILWPGAPPVTGWLASPCQGQLIERRHDTARVTALLRQQLQELHSCHWIVSRIGWGWDIANQLL